MSVGKNEANVIQTERKTPKKWTIILSIISLAIIFSISINIYFFCEVISIRFEA